MDKYSSCSESGRCTSEYTARTTTGYASEVFDRHRGNSLVGRPQIGAFAADVGQERLLCTLGGTFVVSTEVKIRIIVPFDSSQTVNPLAASEGCPSGSLIFHVFQVKLKPIQQMVYARRRRVNVNIMNNISPMWDNLYRLCTLADT